MTDKPDVTMSTPPDAFVDPFAGLVRGRVVHYTPTPAEARYADADPWAALVTHVGPLPGQVTLAVFPPIPTAIGTDPAARRVEVPFDADGAPGTWNWPARS